MIKTAPHSDFLQDIFSSSEAPLSLLHNILALASSPFLTLLVLPPPSPTIHVSIKMKPSPQPAFLLATSSSRSGGEHLRGQKLRNDF